MSNKSVKTEMLILIIEDDVEIARLTEIYLQSEGYTTLVVADGNLAVDTIKNANPDLVLLDLMLPGVDGFEICKLARSFFTGPILVLTARDDDLSEVSLLKLGADDYLRKPAKPHVMSARIEALLRRSHRAKANSITDSLAGLEINRENQSVTLNQSAVDLTTAEFELLELLADNVGRTVSREDCIQSLRGINYDVSDRSIDMRISGIRKKLNDEKPPYKLIKTIRNKGYMLVDE